MKFAHTTLIGLLFVLLSTAYVSSKQIFLKDAVRKGLIKMDLKGQGSNLGRCLRIHLENVSTEQLEVVINSGRMFSSTDTVTQKMVLTQSIKIPLLPEENKDYALYAMCLEKSMSSPAVGILFNLGGMARSSVLALVKLIEKKHYQNGVAQNALWVLTDQASITNITGKDYEMVHELRQFVCNATGRKMPPPYVTEASKPIYTISVEVEYSLEENGLITILLYDQNGNIIKELFRDRFHDKGTHRYNYEMNGISLPTDNYYLKLYQDGVLKLQIRSILK